MNLIGDCPCPPTLQITRLEIPFISFTYSAVSACKDVFQGNENGESNETVHVLN